MSVRILLIHRAGWGGAERTLLDLVEGLPQDEYKLTAAVPPGRFCDELTAKGFDVKPAKIPSWRKVRDAPRSWFCLRVMGQLGSELRAQLVVAGDIRSVPYALAAAKQAHCPCLAFVQDGTIQKRHIRAYRVHRADMVLCPSGHLLDRVRLGGVRPGRSLLFPVGIDTERFCPASQASALRKEWEMQAGAVLVGCVGSISHLKGQDILLEAMLPVLENNPEVQLIFVGSGRDEFIQETRSRAGRFVQSDRVRFAGWREDVPAVLAALDLVVVPSRAESFSRAVAEAMAVGKPVIATQTGAVEELFDGDRCGVSVPVGDTTALREALTRVLMDPDLRYRLGQAAQERIRQSFSLRESQKTFRKIVQSLIRRRGKERPCNHVAPQG